VIHLDTNVAIALLNGHRSRIREQFDGARLAGTPLALSMVVYHELMYGAACGDRRSANENKIALFLASGGLELVAFEQPDAREAADIRAYLRRQATPIGPYDVLIAGQARRAGASLVTAKGKEFVRVPGLIVMDWAI
jgi:tRNA(fMet)-specific endonuclease VapC